MFNATLKKSHDWLHLRQLYWSTFSLELITSCQTAWVLSRKCHANVILQNFPWETITGQMGFLYILLWSFLWAHNNCYTMLSISLGKLLHVWQPNNLKLSKHCSLYAGPRGRVMCNLFSERHSIKAKGRNTTGRKAFYCFNMEIFQTTAKYAGTPLSCQSERRPKSL